MNADLALSVATTAVSTLVSVVMLPLNLFLYSKLAFDENALEGLEWGSLFISIAVITAAITLGLIASERENSHYFNVFANNVGNAAGISLVIFSTIVSSSSEDANYGKNLPPFILVWHYPVLLG